MEVLPATHPLPTVMKAGSFGHRHRPSLESFRRVAVWRDALNRITIGHACGQQEMRLPRGQISLAFACGKREIKSVMRQPKHVAPKKFDYPEETSGSRLAAKARKLANKLTPEQRREHFNGAMTMIYGGAKEATLARR
jgi:hypothetical protein